MLHTPLVGPVALFFSPPDLLSISVKTLVSFTAKLIIYFVARNTFHSLNALCSAKASLFEHHGCLS